MKKIVCIGVRAIPYTAGIDGVLTELAPRLVKMGYDVTVYVRAQYNNGRKGIWDYNGVRIKSLPCIKNKYLETITYTLLAIIDSLKEDYTIYYFHAVVTGMFIPLVKIFNKKVLLHTHGLDWKREKWNWFAKFIIRLSTRIGISYADKLAAVSKAELEYFKNNFGKDFIHLPNGVCIQEVTSDFNEIKKYNIEPKKYILFLSRLVPEKGCHFLIDAYKLLPEDIRNKYKLVIAGDTNYRDDYYYSLKAEESENIIFTGFATGDLKRQLLSNAALFVQPSTMEGMPLTLLEAMGFGLPVVGSNIPEISSIIINENLLFESGNINSLYEVLKKALLNLSQYQENALQAKDKIIGEYNWDKIAFKLDNLLKSFA